MQILKCLLIYGWLAARSAVRRGAKISTLRSFRLVGRKGERRGAAMVIKRGWTEQTRRLINLATLAAAASIGLFLSPFVQAQEVPNVITPPEVATDPNGLNLMTGQIKAVRPQVSVPAAPRLTFSRASDFIMYAVGQRNVGTKKGFYSIHYGGDQSESFECQDGLCQSGYSNSGFSAMATGPSTLTREKSREKYSFDIEIANWVDSVKGINHTEYYASRVEYPDGEVLVLTYDLNYYRVMRVQSSTGYFLELTYWDSLGYNGALWVKTATIYANAAPTTPLSRLEYSSDGNQATDLASRTWSCGGGCGYYAFDRPWRTSDTVTRPGESAASLTYASVPGSAFLTQSIAQDGVAWNYSYTGIASQYVNGALRSYKFDTVSVSGPDGYARTYHINTWDKGAGADTRYEIEYVANSVDELNRTTTYTYEGYNKTHRLTGIGFPEGNAVQLAYDQAGNIIRRTDKAKPGSGLADLLQTAEYSNWRPVWYRDARGNQTDFVFNAQGLLQQQLDPADQAGIRQRKVIEYEAYQTPYYTVIIGPLGREIRIAQIIYRQKKVRVCGVLASNPDACVTDEPYTTYEYFGHTFLPTVVTEVDPANGQTRTTTHAYDGAGRVLSIDGPLPGTGDTKYFRYDSVGRRTWEISELTPAGTRLATRTTYRAADDKVTKVETGTVPDATSGVLTALKAADTTYDSRRYPIRERLYSGATTFAVTDRSFLNRGLTQCTAVRMNLASLPAATATGACSLGTEGSQGPDRITKNLYDTAGQLLQVRKAVGTAIELADVTYAYTNNGKTKFVIDANGNKAELRYDGYDRQVRWVFPSITRPASFNPATPATAVSTAGALNESDYVLYGYDAAGNRTSLRKRDGSTLTYQFDNLNRLIRKTVPERTDLASTHTRDVFYGFDWRGLQTHARFDSTSGQGMTNVYDGFGRQTSATVNLDAQSRQLAYQYDLADNRTRITWPDAVYLSYAYDALSRLSSLTNSASHALVTPVYNTHGLLASAARYGTAHDQSFTYDAIGRLATLGIAGGGQGAPAVSWTFTRNAASQILSEARNNDSYAWGGQINVDRNYTTNGLNQYTAAGAAAFCYDANGNLTADGTSVYKYDVENRLVEKRAQGTGNTNCASLSYTGSIQAALRYDPLGRLYELGGAGGAVVARFLHDGDAFVGEYNSAGTLLRRYVHGADAGVDDPLIWFEGASTASTDARHLYAEPRGSIALVGNAGGATIAINSYDEYGIPGSANQGRFQYTGQAWLPELGMYYYKARIYSPTLGRFLQIDPVAYEDQANLYAYVANDPVNNTDPTGQVIDTIADVAFIVADVADISQNGLNWENGISLGANIVGAAIPGATGLGAGTRAISRGADAARTATRTETRASQGERAARGTAGGERAGRPFTPRGRETIDRRNVERHGKPTCENCKREVTPGQRHERGVTPPGNERQRDHIIPRSQGGDGSPSNGQVLCRDCNLEKRDRRPE